MEEHTKGVPRGGGRDRKTEKKRNEETYRWGTKRQAKGGTEEQGGEGQGEMVEGCLGWGT